MADVLQSLLKDGKEPISLQFESLRLEREWGAIVGPTMAQHSRPLGLSPGALHVWVDSPARLQEMVFLVQTIREKVNRCLGTSKVKRIQFTLDRGALPKASPRLD
jgi:predicted nucleic acid-binding Zn ribbon protein